MINTEPVEELERLRAENQRLRDALHPDAAAQLRAGRSAREAFREFLNAGDGWQHIAAAVARELRRDATQRDPDDARYPCQIAVYCDVCEVEETSYYLVHVGDDRETRLGYARAHLRKQGWRCDGTGDFCPPHAAPRPAAHADTLQRIASSIDWNPTCLPGQERVTIVRQILAMVDPAAPSPEEVERAAHALAEEYYGIPWRELDDHQQDNLRSQARVALEGARDA